jgi:UDP-3-O-[3-hydroxymyristoyl] glucosamine N-acyltransferase
VSVTVRQLAEWINGEVCGDAETEIAAAMPIDDARPGDVTFAESSRRVAQLHHCLADAAIVPLSTPPGTKTIIRVADPIMAFALVVQRLHSRPTLVPEGIHPRASVHPSAKIGKDAWIEPLAVVGIGSSIGDRCRLGSGVVIGRGCRLGDDVTIFPNVVIYDGTVIGNRVTIHANAVIGSDGYGYRTHGGCHIKVPQLGFVEIGDDVEIGAGTTIDRGTFGPTRIGTGTKIDNLVQIGHNCRIGRHNLLVSQVGLSGSVTTGDHVILAGQVGVADHVEIGERTIVGAKAGVVKDVPADQHYLGAPATAARDQKRILMSMEHLPEIRRDVARIKRQMGLTDEKSAG